MMKYLLMAFLLAAAGALAGAQPPADVAATPLERAFHHLYNMDFTGAHDILDEYVGTHPDDPLGYSVRAAACLFQELDRLKILETDFFAGDDAATTKTRLEADPRIRARLFLEVEEARRLAQAVLVTHPDDRDALFALCMSASVVTDYTALVERRQWASVSLSRQTQLYARQLLSLDPPVYDAYLAMGTVEYVVGSMPFYIRWFVRFPEVQGSKQKGVENLRQTAERGRYYAPFAKILLAVIFLREERLEEAEEMLDSFARDFPDNPLVQKELKKVRERLARAPSGGRRE